MRKKISIILICIMLTGCSARGKTEEIYECNTQENEKYYVDVEKGIVIEKETGEESKLIKDAFFDYEKPLCYSLYGDIFYFDEYAEEYTIYAVSILNGEPKVVFNESGNYGGISFLDELYNSGIPEDTYMREELKLSYMSICGPIFVYIRNYELHSMDLRSLKDTVLAKDCSDIIDIKNNTIEYYDTEYIREKVEF